MGQDLRDLIDTMFWLKASPEKRTSETVRNVLVGTTPAAPAEFPEVPGNGFVKIGLDGKWFTDPTVFLTKREGDSYYFRNNQFPMDPAVYLAGDRTFKNFVDSARASFTGGDGIDIVAGDIRVDNTVSRVGHQHSLTLSGDVSGSGQVAGTISTTVNAIRGGVVPPPASSGYFYWTGSSYSWIATPPPATIALDDLADVALASVAAGQVLWYDGSVGQWINRTMIAADLPAHASRHHFDGADPLAGQSIAGLRISDKPSFAGLIAKVAGTLADIDFHSLAGYRQMSIRWSDTSQQIEVFSSNDTGGARANRMLIPRSSSSPVSILLGLTVTGTTKLDTSLTGMLKATAGVVSVAGASDLPLHASRHQWDGADPIQGQQLVGLRAHETPTFGGIRGGSVIGYIPFLENNGTEIMRLMSTGMLVHQNISLDGDLRIGNLTGVLYAQNGTVRVALGSELPSHTHFTSQVTEDTNLWFTYQRARDAITGAHPITVVNGLVSHVNTDGYRHVPANGYSNSGKFLVAGGSPGSYSWNDITAGSLPVHAFRHHFDGSDPLAGQSIAGLLTSSIPTFAGLNIITPSAGTLADLSFRSTADLRRMVFRWDNTNDLLELFSNNDDGSARAARMQVPRSSSLPVSILLGLTVTGTTKLDTSLTGMLKATAGVVSVAGSADLPLHASRHQWDGADPLAGQSIAGLLVTSTPRFQSLEIVRALGATIETASKVTLYNNDLSWGQSFWSDSGGNLRLSFLQGDSTWTDRFKFMRTGAFQIGGTDAITSSRGGRFTDLVVTGQTTLSTSLTGMLKATAGVVSVAGANDLPGGPYLPLAGGKRVSGWVAFDSTVYSTEIISFSGYDLGQFGITLNTAFSIQGDLQFEVSSPTNLNNVVSFESKGDFKFRAIRSSVSTTLPVLGNEQVVMLVGDSGPFEWETNLTQEVAYFNGTETTIISAGGNPIGIASLGKCMILVGPISNSSERCSLFIV